MNLGIFIIKLLLWYYNNCSIEQIQIRVCRKINRNLLPLFYLIKTYTTRPAITLYLLIAMNLPIILYSNFILSFPLVKMLILGDKKSNHNTSISIEKWLFMYL